MNKHLQPQTRTKILGSFLGLGQNEDPFMAEIEDLRRRTKSKLDALEGLRAGIMVRHERELEEILLRYQAERIRVNS